MSARKTALPKPPSKRKHRQEPNHGYMSILMSGPLNDRKLVVPQFDIATLFVRVYESGFGVSGYCTKDGSFQALGASNGPGTYTTCRYRRVFNQFAFDAESEPGKGILIFEYDTRSQDADAVDQS